MGHAPTMADLLETPSTYRKIFSLIDRKDESAELFRSFRRPAAFQGFRIKELQKKSADITTGSLGYVLWFLLQMRTVLR